MGTSKYMLVVGATIPILLTACSGATTQRAPVSQSPLGDISDGRNPVEVGTLRQQMHSQIFYKTKKIPEAEYEQLVRPSLVYQLRLAGFAEDDLEQILSDVEYSRRIQSKR